MDVHSNGSRREVQGTEKGGMEREMEKEVRTSFQTLIYNCCGKIPSKIQIVFNASFLSYRPLYIPELTALESDEVSSARCLSDHL